MPIGAAIALTGWLQFLLAAVRNPRAQRTLFLVACLALMLPAIARLYAQHAHFVDIAEPKAKILRQIAEQAPAFSDNTRVMLITDMNTEELAERHIVTLRQNMLASALYLLYGEARPQVAFVCVIGDKCSTKDIDIAHNYLGGVRDFSDVVIFQLHNDLNVQLLRDIPIELIDYNIEYYDPLRLIDESAPLPPRAVTMLGAGLGSDQRDR